MISLATLKDATSQEFFDHVVDELVAQRRSSHDGYSCRYRIGRLCNERITRRIYQETSQDS